VRQNGAVTASLDDHRRLARQAAALDLASTDEESAPWEAAVVATANERRAAEGRKPLEMWWVGKTEPELHRRARALGLLLRDR
jgi:hypothetical protein